MPTIHLINTDFEFELAQLTQTMTIEDTWKSYPLCLQLQYLPLIYAEPTDYIAVTHDPPSLYLEKIQAWRKGLPLPHIINLNNEELGRLNLTCQSWGYSKKVKKWAAAHRIQYEMPDWEIIKEVNSKAYSFSHSPSLQNSDLLWNDSQLIRWFNLTSGKRVLKTCYGLSGRGHFFIDENLALNQIIQFCETEWAQKRPVIAEPWVARVFDFSTQWNIDKLIGPQLVGPTVFQSNEKGVYQSTLCGKREQTFKELLPFLEEHLECAEGILNKIFSLGFYGPIGVDAFIYREQNQLKLQPIVEINARQTMSLAALKFQERWFPDQTIRFFFSSNERETILLPSQVGNRSFKRWLAFQKI